MKQPFALNKKVADVYSLLKEQYSKLSPEKQKLSLAVLIGIPIVIAFSIYSPIIEAFSSQSIELEEIQKKVTSVIPVELKNHFRLKNLRSDIEKEYKQIELHEGTLSYLEKLVKDQIGVNQDYFSIDDNQPPQPFGSIFERTPFTIRFKTSNLEKMTSFLKELSYGKQPFLITKLDMTKTYSGLDIIIDVVSISKKA